MIKRRIHIIDGLPISSKEFNNYYNHITQLIRLLSNYIKIKPTLHSFVPPTIKLG